MQITATLGLIMTAVAITGLMPVADAAESIPSPYKQLKDGVQPDQIQCRDGRILMISPSDRPACVFSPPHVLELRGFVLVEKPLSISYRDLTENFDLRIVTDPAEMPAPLGHKGGQKAFWPDYQTGQGDIIVIEYFKDLYREIDLDYEITGGKASSYLGVDFPSIVFFFTDVEVQGTFNVTISYLLHPPVTSYNIPKVVLFELSGGAVSTDNAVIVHNQTSVSQIFSFEISPGSGDFSLFFNAVPDISDSPNLLPVLNFYGNGFHHTGSCSGNLIPIPRTDGTHLCIQPIMLEFILVAHESWVDESIYEEIIKKHEEYACPADAPVFLVRYDHSSTVCVTPDAASDLLSLRGWVGDYTLSGSQYALSFG